MVLTGEISAGKERKENNYVDGIKSMGFTSLKTPNSYRTIPFMGGVEDILKTQREKQIKEKKRLKHRCVVRVNLTIWYLPLRWVLQ